MLLFKTSCFCERFTIGINTISGLHGLFTANCEMALFFNDVGNLIVTARSNKVATCLGIRDFSQLGKDYGQDQSNVKMNIAGNIISGQVTGDTANFLSERFGKINQVKESVSINRTDPSISKSSQLDFAVPTSKIAGLSSGEFVGMVADDPTQKIKLKTFHYEILNNHDELKTEADGYKELPVIKEVTSAMINENYLLIKKQVWEIIDGEIERMLNTVG
jgi:TraM recognition site of TraD and TraG